MMLGFLLIQNEGLQRENQTLSNHNRALQDSDWDRSTREMQAYLDEIEQIFKPTPNEWPVLGPISSGFGFRLDPFSNQVAMHSGVDIVAPHGTSVAASAPGRVVFSGDGGALGYLIVLEHANSIRSFYGHLSNTSVRQGEYVARKQKIGEVGSTGKSTGPHLHYAIQELGVYRDPMEYLD